MEYLDFVNKITLYIDGELTSLEKKDFEETMAQNNEYKNIFNEIKNNSILLRDLQITLGLEWYLNGNWPMLSIAISIPVIFTSIATVLINEKYEPMVMQ